MFDLGYILPLLAVAVLLICLICARRREARERAAMERRLTHRQAELLERLRGAMHESMRLLNQTAAGAATSQQLADAALAMETRQEHLRRGVEERLGAVSALNEAKLEQLRKTLDDRLDALARLNDQKLEQMRQTVSEKLESTLENRLGESFKAVNEQLSRVYKGLGEMQSLAQGVGDLKKVLTNVKTRGVWGEVRLRALLEDCLSPGQYLENAQVTPGSRSAWSSPSACPPPTARARFCPWTRSSRRRTTCAWWRPRRRAMPRACARRKSSWKTPCASRPGASATNT